MRSWGEVLNNIDVSSNQEINLPSEELLKSWSYRVSIEKSTNKLNVDSKIIELVTADSYSYKAALDCNKDLQNYLYRVKTPDSVKRKVERHPDLKFQSVFNDIVSLRVRVHNYNIYIPEYFRKVDLTKGKANDDGYRAIHLYYKLDNNHYQIEIQLWSDYDYNFNLWSHTYGYKAWDSQILRELRELYDNGEINSYQGYLREAGKLLCQ